MFHLNALEHRKFGNTEREYRIRKFLYPENLGYRIPEKIPFPNFSIPEGKKFRKGPSLIEVQFCYFVFESLLDPILDPLLNPFLDPLLDPLLNPLWILDPIEIHRKYTNHQVFLTLKYHFVIVGVKCHPRLLGRQMPPEVMGGQRPGGVKSQGSQGSLFGILFWTPFQISFWIPFWIPFWSHFGTPFELLSVCLFLV